MPIPARREPADPAEMAPRILQEGRENRRFIFIHPATRPVVEGYYRELLVTTMPSIAHWRPRSKADDERPVRRLARHRPQ